MNGFQFGIIMLAVGTGVLGCLGVLAYFRIRENIRFLLQSSKLIAGRLTTTEHALRGCKETADKIGELGKCVQKLSSSLGQLKKHVADSDVVFTNSVCEIMNETAALAAELGYEVKTVDEGPVPRVTILQQVAEPVERKVSLVK